VEIAPVSGLRAGTAVVVGDLELIPIERTHLTGDVIAGAVALFAAKAPAAVVIRSGSHGWALDLDGRETSLDDLLRDVPGLRERV
jgi:hypothetical protein